MLVLCLLISSMAHAAERPARSDRDARLALEKMSIDEVAGMVPAAAGFRYIGCPHCDGGSQENGVLGWQPGLGDTLRCRFCKMTFPNEQYPNKKEIRITAPDGSAQVYRYYEGPTGRQYFYEAHAWFERIQWLRSGALRLAENYRKTGDLNSADRAAAILARFAQVVPGYAMRFEVPFKTKRFFPADQLAPYNGAPPMRVAKFDSWAYMDIPEDLTRAWEILEDGKYDYSRLGGRFGSDPDALIRKDLLRLLVDVTAANPEQYHNMSPRMYRAMINVGRALNEPKYVHDAIDRFGGLLQNKFYSDGWWCEGSSSYHRQTIDGLAKVAQSVQGYSDPPTWTGSEKFVNLDLMNDLPLLARANQLLKDAVLPNGRMIPVNDTWASTQLEATTTSLSRLWPGLGRAVLGAGSGDNQVCLGLDWSTHGNHAHLDNGSIFLYALGKELLPDIGYTHTRWHNWATNSASHNMVVVGERSQPMIWPEKGSTQGNLRWFDASDSHVRFIDLDAAPSYPGLKEYRRRLALVHAGEGFDYVVDRFDVEGTGTTQDFFLHGSADEIGNLETSAPIETAVDTLVPSWGGRGQYVGEANMDFVGTKFHVYDLLKDVHKTPAAGGIWTATWRYPGASLRAHLIAPKGSTLYRYTSPMIRPAGRLDADLPKYMTPGIMERHQGGQSTFVAVYEPFRDKTWFERVEGGPDKLTISYTMPDGKRVTDTIRIRDQSLEVKSSAGWAYATGKPVGGRVVGLETKNDGRCVLKLDKAAPKTAAVRLQFGPTRSFVFPVASVEGKEIQLAASPGIVMDSPESAHFTTFPHEKLTGRIEWAVYSGR
ncbi:MAG: heparinase II/III family protein [Candidatus Sumerlaeia bacterium]